MLGRKKIYLGTIITFGSKLTKKLRLEYKKSIAPVAHGGGGERNVRDRP